MSSQRRPKPVLFDFFCKAGGAGMGYHMAGFDVIGFDIEPQPNYPFEFHQLDVLELDPGWVRETADVVTGSPPCKIHTILHQRHFTAEMTPHLDLIPPTRALFEETGLPWVIENVEGARPSMVEPITLCGSSFGLRVRRHRLFESNYELRGRTCDHDWQDRHRPYKVHMTTERATHFSETGQGYKLTGVVPVFGNGAQILDADRHFRSVAMGIDWMTVPELSQAIPPAYTHHLGKQLMRAL